jgi:ribonuclease Z
LKFELTILGSGGAIPTISKKPTAQFLNIQNRYFLIDCGEGTQIQLRKYKCKFLKIDHIFISHLHGDHYLGLMGLLSSLNLLGRTNDLTIYAPRDIQKLLAVHEEISKKGFGFKIKIEALNFNEKTLLYEDNVLKIFSFPVSHSVPCCGFLFKEKPTKRNLIKEKIEDQNFNIETLQKLKNGEDCMFEGKEIKHLEFSKEGPKSRSYAFCADTQFDEGILNYIDSLDLIYHESTFLDSMKNRAKKTFHSTALDAGKIALLANANKLLIGHFSARYNDVKAFEIEAKSVFENTVAVKDGDVFNIENR